MRMICSSVADRAQSAPKIRSEIKDQCTRCLLLNEKLQISQSQKFCLATTRSKPTRQIGLIISKYKLWCQTWNKPRVILQLNQVVQSSTTNTPGQLREERMQACQAVLLKSTNWQLCLENHFQWQEETIKLDLLLRAVLLERPKLDCLWIFFIQGPRIWKWGVPSKQMLRLHKVKSYPPPRDQAASTKSEANLYCGIVIVISHYEVSFCVIYKTLKFKIWEFISLQPNPYVPNSH